MLTKETIKKIEDFIFLKPRSVQEIAENIKKNWRTADRYIEEIEKEYGTITTRLFREGTRGALKIVYWQSIEKRSSTAFQEELEKMIFIGKTKYDFAPFDIFQHVDENKKIAWKKYAIDENDVGKLINFKNLLLKAKKQVLFFSGNLSFMNFKDNETNIFEEIENLVKKGISIKVICRIEQSGLENIQKLLSLNHKYGKELIEIRHREQPLRATMIDNKIINLKEIKEPTKREFETDKRIFIFYTIEDSLWAEWLTRIFWKMFFSSIDSKKRLDELNNIHTLKE